MRPSRLVPTLLALLLLAHPARTVERLAADPSRDGPGEVFLRLDRPVGSDQSFRYRYTLRETDGREAATGDFTFRVPAGAALSANRLSFPGRPPGVYRLSYRPLGPGRRAGEVGVAVRGAALRPAAPPPDDFADRWKRALFALDAGRARASVRRRDDLSRGPVDVYEVRYRGYGGTELFAWFCRPAGRSVSPGLLLFHGYGGHWPNPPLEEAGRGFAVLAPEIRSHGRSVDPAFAGREIICTDWSDPDRYFFHASYLDAAVAVEILASLPGVDARRLLATGSSMGGAHAVAAAALSHRIAAVAVSVPFLCDIRRSARQATEGPYRKLVESLRRSPRDESPLDYFDVANFARLLRCPVRVSAGLLDRTSPPASILAMHNVIPGEKFLALYDTGDHECRVEDKPALIAWLEEQADAGR